ncbi:hypothetical protein [Clostridium sardiniense]|uniref:hypothetical protein n=1 Tax=Clostridium sardiniense TaxID=29369 RepID=UPI003D33D69D
MKKLIIVLVSTAIIFLFAFEHEYIPNESPNKGVNFISYKRLDNVISNYLKKDYKNRNFPNSNQIFLSYDIVGKEVKNDILLAYITYSLSGYKVDRNIAQNISNEDFNGVISISKSDKDFIVTDFKSISHNQDIKTIFPKKYILKTKINPNLKHREIIKEKLHMWQSINKVTIE